MTTDTLLFFSATMAGYLLFLNMGITQIFGFLLNPNGSVDFSYKNAQISIMEMYERGVDMHPFVFTKRWILKCVKLLNGWNKWIFAIYLFALSFYENVFLFLIFILGCAAGCALNYFLLKYLFRVKFFFLLFCILAGGIAIILHFLNICLLLNFGLK